MEERFQLKKYGNLSFFEQAQMPADERQWYLQRLQKEAEREKEQAGEVPRAPGMPNIPNVPRP